MSVVKREIVGGPDDGMQVVRISDWHVGIILDEDHRLAVYIADDLPQADRMVALEAIRDALTEIIEEGP